MSRLSSVYRSDGSNTYSGRRNHLIVPKDEFPILDFKELSICLQTCDFIANEELVSKPTSQYIRSLLEQVLDTFMAVPPDHIGVKVKDMAQRDSSVLKMGEEEGEKEEEEDTENTLYILVLFRASFSFLQTCGVYDFMLQDIMRPEPQRTRRILSAVINYARFREEHSRECEGLLTDSEGNIEEIRTLRDANTKYSNDIQELREKLLAGIVAEGKKTTFKQISAFNQRLESELKKLQKSQQLLTLEHSKYKEEKQLLIEKLEDHHYLNIESSRELDKLKSYLQINPSMLRNVIEDLRNNLNEIRNTHNELEAGCRNKSATIESIQVIEQELKSLFRLLEEILNDLQRSDASADKLVKYQEFLDQQRLQSSDLNRQILLVKRQLENLDEKLKKLLSQADEKEKLAKGSLSELKTKYEELVEERKVREQELDQKKELISNLEKQMAIKKNEFQMEIRNAESAVSRLTAHLKLYLTEMNNKI